MTEEALIEIKNNLYSISTAVWLIFWGKVIKTLFIEVEK